MKKGESTRLRIIQKAIYEISREGFDKASLHTLAKSCGVTHQAILYHFKSKLGLFTEIFKYSHAMAKKVVHGSVEKKDNAYEKLLVYFRSFISWQIIYKKESEVIVLFAYYGSVKPKLATIYSDFIMYERKLLEEILSLGVSGGEFRLNSSVEVAAKLMLDNVFGLMMNSIGARDIIISNTEYENYIHNILNTYLEVEQESA